MCFSCHSLFLAITYYLRVCTNFSFEYFQHWFRGMACIEGTWCHLITTEAKKRLGSRNQNVLSVSYFPSPAVINNLRLDFLLYCNTHCLCPVDSSAATTYYFHHKRPGVSNCVISSKEDFKFGRSFPSQ